MGLTCMFRWKSRVHYLHRTHYKIVFENANDTEKLNCRYGYPAARWVHFASDSFLSFAWSHSIEESNYKRSLHERLKSIREKKKTVISFPSWLSVDINYWSIKTYANTEKSLSVILKRGRPIAKNILVAVFNTRFSFVKLYNCVTIV